MTRSSEKPLKQANIGKALDGDKYTHPAFGVISMGIVSGGSSTLFGSDIKHRDRVRIEIKQAKLERNLSNDWIHSQGRPIVEFEMSQLQFAEFILSQNRSSGTPVTLTFKEGESIPSIDADETKVEMFRREVEQSAKKQMEGIITEVAKLHKHIESGKLSKVELREICKNLTQEAGHLPGNISFVVGEAQEAIEKATHGAKADVEAYVNHKINQLGVVAAQNIGLIKPDDFSAKSLNESKQTLSNFLEKG